MNDFQPSSALIARLKLSEGLVLVPRPDPVGIVTYGYGHRTYAGERVPPSITELQADILLDSDAAKAAQAVRKHVTVELTQAQFDALTDFVFNFGEHAFETSTLIHAVNAEDWPGVQNQLRRWVHDHAGHILPGLVTRREWECAAFDGTESGPVIVMAVPTAPLPPDGYVMPTLVPVDFASTGTLTTGKPPAAA